MAKGRMLLKSLAVDRIVAKLSKDAFIVFVSMIPFIDSEGKFYANPGIVKGHCLPFRDEFTLDKIAECLKEIEAGELIVVYGDDREYCYFPGFLKNNSVNEHEPDSVIPFSDITYAMHMQCIEEAQKKGRKSIRKAQEKHKQSSEDGDTKHVLNQFNLNQIKLREAGEVPDAKSDDLSLPLEDVKEMPVKKKSEKKEQKPEYIALAKLLLELMRVNNPKRKPDTSDDIYRHADVVRLMVERELRPLGDIEFMIKASQNHPFWKKNIMSMDTLREKYDRLWVEFNDSQKASPSRFIKRQDSPQNSAPVLSNGVTVMYKGVECVVVESTPVTRKLMEKKTNLVVICQDNVGGNWEDEGEPNPAIKFPGVKAPPVPAGQK